MSKRGDSGRRKSKSKDQRKNEETEDSWVFDSLIGFLRGPVWCVPVMTFIEQKSLGNDFRIKIEMYLGPHTSNSILVLLINI